MIIVICGLLLNVCCRGFLLSVSIRGRTLSPSMSLGGETKFLRNSDEVAYSRTILRKAIDGARKAITDNRRLIEIEFPVNRKSDVSLVETLDLSRNFALEFVKQFSNLGSDLWVLFPDSKECQLAISNWQGTVQCTISSINRALTAPSDVGVPKLVVIVSPGFNVDEWITIPNLNFEAPTIIINGNLDRLRNGYYPALFYPGLTKVSKEYYSKATQALFLQPLAVGGDRLGAWLARVYPGPFEVLVRAVDSTQGYDTVSSSASQLSSKTEWKLAKEEYSKRFGNIF